MSKHYRTLSGSSGPRAKRPHLESSFSPIKIATKDAAAALDSDPPLSKLLAAVENGVKKPKKGASVIYWMRMNDLRSESSPVYPSETDLTILMTNSF